MTEERIRGLLQELAAQAPTRDLVGMAMRQATRARKRRQVAVGAVAATTVTASGLILAPRFDADPGGPAGSSVTASDQRTPEGISPECGNEKQPRPFVPEPSIPMVDMVPIPTPERLVETMDGEEPWAIVAGRIERVTKPALDRSRIDVRVTITDLIHESEPGTIDAGRVDLDFWQGPSYNSGGMVCSLEDWQYALPEGARLVAVVFQPKGRDLFEPHVAGLFFESKQGIKGGMIPLSDLGRAWQRIGSLDELVERFRGAVAAGG